MNKTMIYVTTVITSLVILIISFLGAFYFTKSEDTDKKVRVGFLFDGDESTPYTYNFILAKRVLEEKFGEKIEFSERKNVRVEKAGEVLDELIAEDCDIIFSNSIGYADVTKEKAAAHPEVQFCQATGANALQEPVYENYHTFMGRVYEGRYISGVIAGLKLRSLIDEGRIGTEDARVGYVAAYPVAEVISGYTAFLMGVRSVCPQAVMKVKYINCWSEYTKEKKCAQELIDEGCVIISQHSDTVGPAVACEESYPEKTAFHVGYNQSMIDVAPATSLVSTRINWAPYLVTAVTAVLEHKDIESILDARINGNDAGAGFDKDWVQMLELNQTIVSPGTADLMKRAIQDMIAHKTEVFKGEYTGHRQDAPDEMIDLKTGFQENEKQSAPCFDYILDDVIEIE